MTQYKMVNGEVVEMSPEEEAEFDASQNSAVTEMVPHNLPWWKGQAIIAVDGNTQKILDFIESLPEPSKTLARLAWEGADFVRTSPMVIAALDAAGYTTDEQKDALFVRGSKITL